MAKRYVRITEKKEGDEKEFRGTEIEATKNAEENPDTPEVSEEVPETTGTPKSIEAQSETVRTFILTITDGKAIRIFFENGKEVGREEAK